MLSCLTQLLNVSDREDIPGDTAHVGELKSTSVQSFDPKLPTLFFILDLPEEMTKKYILLKIEHEFEFGNVDYYLTIFVELYTSFRETSVHL